MTEDGSTSPEARPADPEGVGAGTAPRSAGPAEGAPRHGGPETAVWAVVLAAGRARRFGGPKLLLPWRGRPVLAHVVLALASAGFPVAVHVVDIETLQVTLDAFSKSAPPPGLADRIEHNALCLPEQVAAIAASGARVVVNPSFLSKRRAKYERELSVVEQGWLIRIRSLLDAGADVRAGSDSPVTEADPQEMIRAATAHPFAPGESVDLVRARGLLRW